MGKLPVLLNKNALAILTHSKLKNRRSMMHPLIQEFEKKQMKKNSPSIKVGDIVCVSKIIQEGKKKRTQRFEGTVIKCQGSNSRRSFTVRKIIASVGVEKTFLLHSPLLSDVTVTQRSKVRRAKLYYLRDRIGAKANRLKKRTKKSETR
tara:strand:+ start:153 stop:599 length:447 start_codon:yes stop_codon:yes gene_type:complete